MAEIKTEVVSVIQRTDLDDQGNFSRFWEIKYRVNNQGPYSVFMMQEDFDLKKANTLVAKQAADIVGLMG